MTLTELIARFLRDALAKLEPKREQERAAELRESLAGCASEDDLWAELIVELGCEPPSFTRCVHLIALYVDERHGEAETRHGANLLRSALAGGAYDIATLVQAAQEGYFWRALAQLLPELELETDLVLHLARQCRPKGQLATEAVQRWAAVHPGTAAEAVERHLDDLVRLAVAAHHGLFALVEGAVAGGAGLTWRDHVVGQLLGDVDDRAHALGVQLTCWAWPDDADFDTRHDRIAEIVSVAPRARAQHALQALRRDAFSSPQATMQTALRLVEMVRFEELPVETATAFTAPALEAIGSALGQLRKRGIQALVDDRVGRLVMMTRPGWPVDSVLTEMFRIQPDATFELFAAWLSRFAPAVAGTSISELLSLLAHEAGPAVLARWYVGLLTSSSPSVRAVAAHLLAHEARPQLDKEAVGALSSRQFEALVHQLLGTQTLPAEDIARFALSFLEQRPADRAFLREIVLELASLYPGACGEEVTRRRNLRKPNSRDAVTEEIEDAVARMLEERRKRLAEVIRLPELIAGSPVLREYRLLEARQQRRIMEEAQRRSVLLQVASRQPIACGEGTVQHPGDAEIAKFTGHEFSGELPTMAAIDPVGNALRCIDHLSRAQSLLAGGDDEET